MDWRRVMLGVIMLLAIGSGYIVFNNTNKYPFEFKRGLDIQGGMHLVLQARTTDKVKEITPQVMSAAIAVDHRRSPTERRWTAGAAPLIPSPPPPGRDRRRRARPARRRR